MFFLTKLSGDNVKKATVLPVDCFFLFFVF